MNTMAAPTHSAVAALRWRSLQVADFPAMHALHLRSIAHMPSALVKPETPTFLHELLAGRGRVVGAWHGDTLIAYGVLQHDLLAQDDPRAMLGLNGTLSVHKLAGAAVDPAWRGHGLQRMLIAQRMEWNDGAVLFATAAPGNPASWRSLMACGFAVRALQYRYGGHARYLLAHVPGECLALYSDVAQEYPLEALLEQERLLAQGWRGVAPGRLPGSLRLAQPVGGFTP